MKAIKLLLCFFLLTSCSSDDVKGQNDDDEVVIKIMPLGDSITNDGRSRVGLWDALVDSGFDIDFVGSRTQNGVVPDPDHEGVGGATIQDVADKINDLLLEYEPDYINLMIGTNDVAGYYEEPGNVIADEHDALIQQIFDNAPNDIGLVVSTIPPASPKQLQNGPLAGSDRSENVKLYNEALIVNMQKRIDAGEKIVLADVFTPLAEDTAAYLFDGIHPNGEGYEIVGAVWGEAMLELLEMDGRRPINTEIGQIPFHFELLQNYPNPFNPSTIIRYQLAVSGLVDLEVFDATGRKLVGLINGVMKPAGSHEINFDASQLSSGMYFYRLQTNGQSFTKKMTLVK